MHARTPEDRRVATLLPADASSAQAARRFLRDWLSPWGLSAAVIENAQLLVSELTTNAVRHGRGAITVTVGLTVTVLRVGVQDASDVEPQRRVADLQDEGGRGIWLVEALSTRYGITQHPGTGKTVWFELDPAT